MMKWLIIAGERERSALSPDQQSVASFAEWSEEIPGATAAGAVADLLFDGSDERIAALSALRTGLVVVNAVARTAATLPPNFVRINAWPGFLERPLTEAACREESLRKITETAWAQWGKTISWTPDVPGFAAARIVSMIINEAWLALEEGVSTEADIDTAMQLGTNYPHGPFAWGRLIGLTRVAELLTAMQKEDERYTPAPLLLAEAHRP